MKIFKSVYNLQEFNSLKVSTNQENTEYYVALTGETLQGTPDVRYEQVVFIETPPAIWTRGVYYFALDENVNTDLVTLENRIAALENVEGGTTPDPDVPDTGVITFTLHQNKYGIEKTYTAYAGMTWQDFTTSDTYDHTSPEGVDLALFWNLGSSFILRDKDGVEQELDTVIRNGYVYTYTGN